MTIEEAKKGWQEVCQEFDKHAGKKLVGIVGFEGTTVVLYGKEEHKEICGCFSKSGFIA